jgi:threonine dehydratase
LTTDRQFLRAFLFVRQVASWHDRGVIDAQDALALEQIQRARAAIDPVFLQTPQFVHEGLSARTGVPVIVKVESVNPIRSFKGRGTWLAVQGLAEERRIGPQRPVVVASAGNFGQGVAYAARAIGVRAVVFVSRHANRGKVARMRALGATVIEGGEDFDDARVGSELYAAEHDAELLVDGDDIRIATGAATMALEVTDAVDAGVLPAPAIALIPVGNGSLINGVASGLRARAADCRVIGVQAEAAPAMTLSWRAGRPIDTPSAATYADGIGSRIAIPAAVALMAGRVDDMVLLSEAALHAAQDLLTEELGVTVEGAAAAAWAALERIERPTGAALLIITGSNT